MIIAFKNDTQIVQTSRHNSKEMQLKLAQAHLLLGEIHMEQGTLIIT